MLSVWLRVIRVRFLLASVIAVSVGLSLNWQQNSSIDPLDAIDLELPEWIIYIVIGGILMVGVIVVMFLRKSKGELEEEEWEEEEI